ncbi:hypothetical protein GPK34_10990 [Secundilactobacillus kimchicus]|uniref:hypothetical protein n=1 Tax=Secundilactobacillus kimchicus TaxID=528209 RepID=UPI001C01F107|nr:hypothetical protein [Secundilactobacillus kimchicus]MBT9672550.1 hypothetical protein [Secundilactobacillus kimchicus]
MTTFYIQRLNTGSHRQAIIDLMATGKLVQGFSYPGMTLDDYDQFHDAWRRQLKWDLTDDEIHRHFLTLQLLKAYQPEDVLVLPKVPDSNHFRLVTVSAPYYFSETPAFQDSNEFRSVVPVDPATIQDFAIADYPTIRAGFKTHRRNVNRIKDATLLDAIAALTH